jgi:hypothetical protein
MLLTARANGGDGDDLPSLVGTQGVGRWRCGRAVVVVGEDSAFSTPTSV